MQDTSKPIADTTNSEVDVVKLLQAYGVINSDGSELTLPSLFTHIYVTFTFPMEGQFKVYLQFVHSSVLRVYIYV